MYVHGLHSGWIHGFSGAFSILEETSPNESGPHVSYCTISVQLSVCHDRDALTQPGLPFLPNSWSTPTLRSSTPALAGANSQVFLACLYVFQLTATLSQSGEITPTPHSVAGPQILDSEGPCTVKGSKPTFSF